MGNHIEWCKEPYNFKLRHTPELKFAGLCIASLLFYVEKIYVEMGHDIEPNHRVFGTRPCTVSGNFYAVPNGLR